MQDGADRIGGIGGGINPNDGVAAAVEEAFEGGEKDATNIVNRMIGLPECEHSALAKRVAAAGDVADFGRSQDQILIAHDLRNSSCDFRDDGVLN